MAIPFIQRMARRLDFDDFDRFLFFSAFMIAKVRCDFCIVNINILVYCRMKRNIALCNGTIYNAYEVITAKSLLIADGIIEGIVADNAIPSDYTIVDVSGMHICPGLIDLQIYGTGTDLFSADLSVETLLRIDRQLLEQGCTSYLITLATNTLSLFQEAIGIHALAKPQASLGMHLEGPFLNQQKRGAHPAALIIPASKEHILSLGADFAEVVKMITVAPELVDPALIAWLMEQGIVISAGHSAATCAQAKAAFELGIPAVTHLWNAMSTFHHRGVGLPGALFSDTKACASIIVDGLKLESLPYMVIPPVISKSPSSFQYLLVAL